MGECGFVRACNFYVSRWHLFAALLPYFKEELKKKNKIVVISEDDLHTGMKELVEKVEIRFERGSIDDIDWISNFSILKFDDCCSSVSFIVQGTSRFVRDVNLVLKEKFSKGFGDIRVINCFELYDTNNMLYDILDEHDFVFNTGGLHEIKELFPEYVSSKEKAKIH